MDYDDADLVKETALLEPKIVGEDGDANTNGDSGATASWLDGIQDLDAVKSGNDGDTTSEEKTEPQRF